MLINSRGIQIVASVICFERRPFSLLIDFKLGCSSNFGAQNARTIISNILRYISFELKMTMTTEMPSVVIDDFLSVIFFFFDYIHKIYSWRDNIKRLKISFAKTKKQSSTSIGLKLWEYKTHS